MEVLGKEQLMNNEKHLGMSLATKLLRYGGMWPNINDKSYKAYTCIVALNCVLFMTLLSHIYFSDDKDPSAVIENTDHILTVASYIVTMMSILNNKGIYNEIVSSIQSLISYSESDFDDDRKRAVRRGIYVERKLCTYYLTAISTTTSCFLLKPLVTIVLSNQEVNLASMDFPLKLMPFTDRTSVLKVAFEYLCHCSILSLLVVTIVPLDLFTFTLIKYLAKQFEVLRILLSNIGDHNHGRDNVPAPSLEAPDSLNQKSQNYIGRFGPLNEYHSGDFYPGDDIRGFKIQAGDGISRNRIMNQMRAENDIKLLVKCHQEILE
ncbi:hypothetical protein PR048_004493 [Dryococelus australis]|uniref:Odorant receptor n=1 Tax=Dryococelus australis TaxID=614101 RepID=A0ABQ9I5K1_9NEOP|nr:hypothetical protein PR048_004493 [Dryococelus australis]